MKLAKFFILLTLLGLGIGIALGQSTDIFVMPGSDFVRPGLYPRSNLNIGIGHDLPSIKTVIGSEITASYTYENAGSHGFWHTQNGAHTSSLGMMRNFKFKNSKFSAYTWGQLGVTSLTGKKVIQNRFYNGESLGLAYHFTPHQGIWLQEQYNKVETVPWYTSTSIGYVFSF